MGEDAGPNAKAVDSSRPSSARGLALFALGAQQIVRMLDRTHQINKDMHYGNLLWDDEAQVLWLLDFGNAGYIDKESRDGLASIFSFLSRVQ